MSMTRDANPNAGAADRPEMSADGIGLPYHAPELREYGTLQELTLASNSGVINPNDSQVNYGANSTPGVS